MFRRGKIRYDKNAPVGAFRQKELTYDTNIFFKTARIFRNLNYLFVRNSGTVDVPSSKQKPEANFEQYLVSTDQEAFLQGHA